MSVRHTLLGLLAQRPRHGYELHAAFLALVGGERNWDLKPAQVYTTLERLEEAGLVCQQSVDQDGGPEKRIYALTPDGMVDLRGWLGTPVASRHPRDEFFLKLVVTLATGASEPLVVIRIQRAALFQELHDLTMARSQTDPRHALAQVLLYDQAVMHLEADLRWLEMVESRLDEMRRQPLPEPELRKRGRPAGKAPAQK